jgi:hypothetical protein
VSLGIQLRSNAKYFRIPAAAAVGRFVLLPTLASIDGDRLMTHHIECVALLQAPRSQAR